MSETDNRKAESTDTKSEISLDENKKTKIKVEWSPENEKILVEWCDIAQCYKWLNMRAHAKYSYLHAWFTIPAIILSTISGTASFAQQSFPPSTQAFVPMAIGSLNIFIGILTTIQQYLKISELNESHRVSSIAWDKFARNIRIELAKKPDERLDAGSFIKHCRDEFDRLMETSPTINDKIVDEFKKTFSGVENSKQRKIFEQLKKPDICDTIISVNETRHKWYLALENVQEEISEEMMNQKEAIIEEQKRQIAAAAQKSQEEMEQKALLEKEKLKTTMKRKMETSKMQEEMESLYKISLSKIESHITAFEEMFDRKPLPEEIKENIGDEISDEHMNKFLETYIVDTIPGEGDDLV
tara:strand:- start:14225 stop:15292 length:1068 start_codon:yes stop_codon:yes gene_type:complete